MRTTLTWALLTAWLPLYAYAHVSDNVNPVPLVLLPLAALAVKPKQ